MQTAYATLINRPVVNADGYTAQLAKDGREHPRILTLGGDHTIVLPILGALYDVYGPITVLHFDAHLDTWNGHELGGAHSEQHKVVSDADRSTLTLRLTARSSGRLTISATSRTRRQRTLASALDLRYAELIATQLTCSR